MWVRALGAAELLTGGMVAGILFMVALALVPCFAQLGPQHYVAVHKLIDHRFDPAVPIIVVVTVALDLVLALSVSGQAERVAYLLAALSMAGVAVVSLTTAVPMLRRSVRGVDPGDLPDDWEDPRLPWKKWHLVRTGCAFGGVLFAVAADLLH